MACGIGSENVSLKLVNVLLAAGVPLHMTNKVNAVYYSRGRAIPTLLCARAERDERPDDGSEHEFPHCGAAASGRGGGLHCEKQGSTGLSF